MIKHGFIFRYNWIWKKNSITNFALMKFRPGNSYEEVMVFTSTPKRGKYFAHAEFNDEVKIKCKFYNYETRTPITSEEVFDKYLIPFIIGNDIDKDVKIIRNGHCAGAQSSTHGIKLDHILNEDIRIPNMGTAGNKMFSTNSTTSTAGIQLKNILNEDIRDLSSGENNFSSNDGIAHIKFDQLFKEKYRDQFEIDLENKILYRTVKSYKNFPTSIIDIKYKMQCNKSKE